jgi:hypothetical protein
MAAGELRQAKGAIPLPPHCPAAVQYHLRQNGRGFVELWAPIRGRMGTPRTAYTYSSHNPYEDRYPRRSFLPAAALEVSY